MDKNENLQRERRKDEHVTLALKQNQELAGDTFKEIEVIGMSVPKYDYADIDLSTTIADIAIPFPLYINAMTGGSRHTKEINGNLAEIAAATGIPMAVGSQSSALKNAELADTFQIARKRNPNGVLFANVSPEIKVSDGLRAVEMIEADALQIHINPVQELVMKEGDRNFAHWLKSIEAYQKELSIPIIVKEVGFGITRETAELLKRIGVKTIDVGGKGGTNFAAIENDRRRDHAYDYLTDWGITTPQSLLDCQLVTDVDFLASGGVKNPLDMLKSLILGANAVGMSGPLLLKLKEHGVEKTIAQIEAWKEQLTSLFLLANAKDIQEVRQTPIALYGHLKEWQENRSK